MMGVVSGRAPGWPSEAEGIPSGGAPSGDAPSGSAPSEATPSGSGRCRGLDIRSVTVRYGAKTAVDEVSAHVEPGQVVALLGPSGSGKSSLLRAIAGLEPVAGGDVMWDGRSVVQTPVHRRGFGLMFQDGQLFPHRSVSGNVAFGLRHLPRAQRAERVKSVLDLVGMTDFADRSVLSLSGGQAQRVALARSLAPAPSLLLLDEPLSALDRSLREHLSGEIRQILRSSGSTCVYVTHDQDEAFTVADVIGVMVDGRLAAWSSPQELWANPGSRTVAEFLGFGPFLPCEGTRMGASTGVPSGAGKDHSSKAAGRSAKADKDSTVVGTSPGATACSDSLSPHASEGCVAAGPGELSSDMACSGVVSTGAMFLAVPPRALRVTEVCSPSVSVDEAARGPFDPSLSFSPWAGGGESTAELGGSSSVISFVARVVDARGARGHVVVDVECGGERMRASAPMSLGSVEDLLGASVRVVLDPTICPHVHA